MPSTKDGQATWYRHVDIYHTLRISHRVTYRCNKTWSCFIHKTSSFETKINNKLLVHPHFWRAGAKGRTYLRHNDINSTQYSFTILLYVDCFLMKLNMHEHHQIRKACNYLLFIWKTAIDLTGEHFSVVMLYLGIMNKGHELYTNLNEGERPPSKELRNGDDDSDIKSNRDL